MALSPFGTRRTRGFIPWLSIAVPAIGWLTFGLYPSAATLFYSLTKYSGQPGTPLNYCGLCNYRAAATNLLPTVGESIRITIIYTVGITIIQTTLALGLAVLLRRAGRMYNVYRALVFMPGIFSVVIIGAAFTLIFDPINGPAQAILQRVFGTSSAFLGSNTLALPIVMGVAIWSGTGYGMLIYIAGLRRVPADVLEAAALDGAGRWKSFWRVSWPLLAPATTVNVFLAAMSALGEYALILVLADGHFGTQTIGVYMFNSAFGPNSQLGYGSMLAVVQFALTVVLGGGLLVLLRRREVSL
jgi:raffinose/stachyose/melibiose transport system permease protein